MPLAWESGLGTACRLLDMKSDTPVGGPHSKRHAVCHPLFLLGWGSLYTGGIGKGIADRKGRGLAWSLFNYYKPDPAHCPIPGNFQEW